MFPDSSAWSVFFTRLSNVYFPIFCITLAGWPILHIYTLPSSFSMILSTAILDGAVQSTLKFKLTHCYISSTTVVVFPVPGGPWIIPKS